MAYEVVNEEMSIDACSLSDLTMDQVKVCLAQWEKGASIGSLIMFYDVVNDRLVLNRDCEQYSRYLSVAQKYLELNEADARKLQEKTPNSMKEVVSVLEHCRGTRNIERDIHMIGKNVYISEVMEDRIIDHLCNDEEVAPYPPILASMAYTYGVIQGKRAERARRKNR